MTIRTDEQLLDGTYGTTNPIAPENTITAERHRDIVESKVSRYSIQNPDDTTPEGTLILENNQKQSEQDQHLADLDASDVEINGKITDLNTKVDGVINSITQIRTTIGVNGITDSDIFNPDVISNADLLWTKHELPGGNLVSVVGEFVVKENQTASYANLFWTTPAGFELMDVPVISGQFVDIMQWTELTNASLNALVDVSGTLGWSNYATINAGNYTISKTLRAL